MSIRELIFLFQPKGYLKPLLLACLESKKPLKAFYKTLK
jgi:hypothetical protein